MSCIQRMNTYPNFTKTEEKLHQFIIEHMNEVVYDTAMELGTKTNTSAAAVIRFSKKLGYKGFTELKVDLARDNQENATHSFSERIEQSDSLEDVMRKAKSSDLNAVEQTYALVDKETFTSIIDEMHKARKIYLVGIGSSGICCRDLAQKLSRIHEDAIYYEDFHLQIASMTYMSKQDLVIAISYSGNTKEVILACKMAKELGANVIGITQLAKNQLQKYLDYSLYIPTIERDLRLGAVTSRNSSLILTDLLYLGYIKDNLDGYKTKLKATRAAVKQISK